MLAGVAVAAKALKPDIKGMQKIKS